MRQGTTAFGVTVLLAILSCALLVAGMASCAPRPPSWAPDPEKLVDSAPWYVDIERFQASAHGSLACEACHGDIVMEDPAQPHPDSAALTEEATGLYDYQACKECHPQAYAAYQLGVHAEAMADPAGIEIEEPAPTCGHCHSAHYATGETRAALLASVSETCGTCHLDALETYQHNYHGKAALLGYENTATCTDCHGAHTVLALAGPTDETLGVLETPEVLACRRCHPEANRRFVDVQIHVHETLDPEPDDPHAQEARILFWVKLFFTVLVVAVLAFFYTHTGLWFLRSLHEKLRSPEGNSRGGQHGHRK